MTSSTPLPPGPARRAKLTAAGRNVARGDFTDEEWAAMEAETAEARKHRRETPPLPVPDRDAS